MALMVEFDHSISRAAPIRLGPFETVELGHRRISADGRAIALRKASGIWSIGSGFLEVCVRPAAPEGAALSLVFTDPWRNGEARLAARAVRLAGDRLRTEEPDDWIATDQDEERSWVLEPNGNAYGRLLAA